MLAEESVISIQQWYLIGGLALFGVFFYMTLRGRRKLDGSPKQYRREIDGATRDSAAVQRDLESLLVELNELAGTLGAQMDSRDERLRATIIKADGRIEELRLLIRQAKALTNTDSALDDSRGPTDVERVTRENVRSTQLDWIVNDEAARSVRHEADELIVTRATAREPEAPAPIPEPPDEMELLNLRVFALANEGMQPVQIAEAVKRTVGEIELMLHLQRRAVRQTGIGRVAK